MSLLKRIEQGQPRPQQSNGSGSHFESPPQNNPPPQPKMANVQARRVAPPAAGAHRDTFLELKARVQNRLLAELDPSMDINQIQEVRATIQDLFDQVLSEENIVLTRPERARLFEQIAAEILGFGPLQPLLEDETITEVMVKWT